MGVWLFLAAMAHTREESSPPERRKAHLGVGDQALLHPGRQLLPDLPAGGVHAVPADLFHLGHIPVGVKLPSLIVAARGEGQDLLTQAQQVFGLAGEEDGPRRVVAVIQGPYAEGVPGGDELVPLPVVEDQGELRVQLPEHGRALFPVKGQQHLAVAAAVKGVALRFQLLPELLKAVDLPVAHQGVLPQPEGLHP